MKTLQRLWTGPLTLAGWIVAAMYCTLPPGMKTWRYGNAWLYIAKPKGWLYLWMLDRGIQAFCWGEVIILRQVFSPDTNTTLLVHEWVHVEQAYRLGPLFPFLYLFESWKLGLVGKHQYWDNKYEVEARAAEDAAMEDLYK